MKAFWKLLFSAAVAVIPSLAAAQSLYEACKAPIPKANPTVPQGVAADDGAFFPQETISAEYRPPQKMATLGFDHLLGMLSAATVYPCDRNKTALIEFQWIKLIRKDPLSGYETVEQIVSFGSAYGLPNGMEWKTFNRTPKWYISGEPAIQPSVASIVNQVYTIDLKAIPKGIFHAWSNPRLPAVPGHGYFVEVMARITGDARLQLGMDYWKGSLDYNGWSEGCLTTNNCQAWLSSWYGDTKGRFVTLRAPTAVYY